MRDFKELTKLTYWLEKGKSFLNWTDQKLQPARIRLSYTCSRIKDRLYPYLRPVINRYNHLYAKNPLAARAILFSSLAFFFGTIFLLFFVSAVYVGVFGKLPSQAELQDINQNLASEVYAADGPMLGKYYIENRVPTDLKDISPFIQDALISTEDARFFEHGGIDLRAWVRVFLRTIILQDESGGGGSTLSQQLAKNLFPRKNHGIFTIPVAKIKELFIARRLEQVYEKEALLTLYLNTVPFGESVFGIGVASKRYFDTNPKDIRLEEAAVLVGMLKATSYYNPRKNPERALERRNVVLSQMVKYNKLDSLTFDSIRHLPIELKYHYESHDQGLATYFREHLRLELEDVLKDHRKEDGNPYNLYSDGLKIYTTIDSRMQLFAEEAVKRQMSRLQPIFIDHFKGYKNAIPWGSDELVSQYMKNSNRYERLKKAGHSDAEIDSLFNLPVRMTLFSWESDTSEKDTLVSPRDSIRHYLTLLRTGFLAAEPQTGKILAWVGGINFKYFKYDHVKSKRQVGSTFKPFVFTKALQEGYSPCERFENELVTYPDGYQPRNSDGEYGGNYSMSGALTHSVNVVAVQLLEELGINNVRNLAKEMGINSEIPNELGIALGSADVSLYEMVQAFSTYPNRGKVPSLYYLTRVETREGKVLFERQEPEMSLYKRAISEEHADVMNRMLQMVVDNGTARRLRYEFNFPYPYAGKTGTSNNNADAWFIGYGPTLITGAWIGADQPAVHWRSTRLGQGGATALLVCGDFLSQVYKDPAFKDLKKKVFAPLNEELEIELDCPDFIHPDSLLADSLRQALLDQPFSAGKLIESIREAFRQTPGEDPSPENTEKEESKLSEKIRKKNERLEKKREREKRRKERKQQG